MTFLGYCDQDLNQHRMQALLQSVPFPLDMCSVGLPERTAAVLGGSSMLVPLWLHVAFPSKVHKALLRGGLSTFLLASALLSF